MREKLSASASPREATRTLQSLLKNWVAISAGGEYSGLRLALKARLQ
jgi:hypothetical protein